MESNRQFRKMADIFSTPVSLSCNKQLKSEYVPKTSPIVQQTSLDDYSVSVRKHNLFSSQKQKKFEKANENNKENWSPVTKNKCFSRQKSVKKISNESPAGIQDIRNKLEQQFSSSAKRCVSGQEVSPGLAKIQNTPGTLKKTRQKLIIKHKEIQNHSDQLGIGGGVTLWPEMDVVRMTLSDILSLLSFAAILGFITLVVFNKVHGRTFVLLQRFRQEIREGCEEHKIDVFNYSAFNTDVIKWHKFLLQKTMAIQDHFNASITSSHCLLYLVMYTLGMSTLVYFLVDNMQAKNKLTPLRIRTWTSLLCVIGTWTILMSCGLYKAFTLEQEAVSCVRQYALNLGYLVTTSVDITTYQSVLLYWRTCLLDSNSDGLIRVLGLVTVKDLIYYLQYYSIPIATVLLTPIFKLVVNVWTVYGNGEHIKNT